MMPLNRKTENNLNQLTFGTLTRDDSRKTKLPLKANGKRRKIGTPVDGRVTIQV